MSVLDGFFSTWSNAKATFGQGTPQTGDQYDGSAKLTQMQSTLDSATPESRWTGGAASTYGTANTEHRKVIGEIAGLDQRLAAHVNLSADVVANGRTQLDAVRKWVVDAAASIPPGKDNDRMLLPIANRGISQVMDIVTKTNGELGTIGGKIRGLGDQYTALGEQKFAPNDGPRSIGPEDEDGEDDDAARKQLAADMVSGALKGSAADAAKVSEVLKSISDDQIAGKAALSPEQQLILGQMGYQTHDLSLQQLSDIRTKIGDQKGIPAD